MGSPSLSSIHTNGHSALRPWSPDLACLLHRSSWWAFSAACFFDDNDRLTRNVQLPTPSLSHQAVLADFSLAEFRNH